MFSHSWSDQASQISKEHRLSSNKLHASRCFLSGKDYAHSFQFAHDFVFPLNYNIVFSVVLSCVCTDCCMIMCRYAHFISVAFVLMAVVAGMSM
jgi:hypothetical protein